MRRGSGLTLCGKEESAVTLRMETERGQVQECLCSTYGRLGAARADVTFAIRPSLRSYRCIRLSAENSEEGQDMRLRRLTKVYTLGSYGKGEVE